MSHLYKIKNKQGELVTFRPNEVQAEFILEYRRHRYHRTVKARQLGLTTLVALDMLDEALWRPGFSGAIIAHERASVEKIFEIVKRAYENLPDSVKPMTNTDTKQAYRFESAWDGTQLDSEIYVAMKLRSSTVQWLHVSEVAYIKDRQELEAGSKQAVPLTGRITEETTGNGFDEFYDSYMEAKASFTGNAMQYKCHFYAWHQDPEYSLPGVVERTTEEIILDQMVHKEFGKHLSDGQLTWRRWKMADMRSDARLLGLSTNQLFKQEYPSVLLEAFQSGAGNVFDSDLVAAIKTQTGIESVFYPGVKIWVEPQAERKYLIGVDPSDGGQDFGVIDVWDYESLEQCAQFRGKLRPDELAQKIADLAVFYNYAFVGVENNLLSTVLFLSKIYDNLYSTKVMDEKTQRETRKVGWSTNTKTRDLMIDDFIIGFEDGSLTIHSPHTVDEMRTFVRKDNGKREHADGKHDDALFAAMIALQMRGHAHSSILDYYKGAQQWRNQTA